MNAIKIVGTPLYQWEVGRKVVVDTEKYENINRVEFSQTGIEETLMVEPREEEGIIVADIPNILLQSGEHIKAYLSYKDEHQLETVSVRILSVIKRPKPTDYVYTETEILSYESLLKRMDEFEKNGVSEEKLSKAIEKYLDEHPVTETDPTVSDWAKASVKPTYTAKEVGALSQDELQNGVNLALKQAKESGEFNGKSFTYEDFTEEQLESLKGDTPKNGIDYFTESEKAEFVTKVINALPTWNGGAY